jgi:hypothetical protein
MPNSPDFAIELNRRGLLVSAAAAVTTSGAIGMVGAELPRGSQTLPISKVVASPRLSNSYVGVASHIAEVERRNLLRKEFGLPLLSVPKEIRRIKTAQAIQSFATFSEKYRSRLVEKMLAKMRRQRSKADWRPVGMIEGFHFEDQVSRRLRRLYKWVGRHDRANRQARLASAKSASSVFTIPNVVGLVPLSRELVSSDR